MKFTICAIISAWFAGIALAQTPIDTFVKGEISINYRTRTQLDGDKPKEGVSDLYTLNLNVSNNAGIRGTISHLPFIKNALSSNQNSQLIYAVDLDAINPRNPIQRLNVGKLTGNVPIDEANVYRFVDGTAKASMFPVGRASAFESVLKGLAAGKPPTLKTGLLDKAFSRVREATKLTKVVNGKVQEIILTNYDQMEFQGHVLPAGPAQVFTETTVNGKLFYDYERESWFLQGVVVTYQLDGKLEQDNLSGNIRWSKAAGEYQFDVRVDEPPPSAGAIFDTKSGTDDFFAVDTTIPSLVGSMKYKDSSRGGIVTDSAVTVDLKGHGLTTQQTMYLAKLFMISMLVPINAE